MKHYYRVLIVALTIVIAGTAFFHDLQSKTNEASLSSTGERKCSP